MFISKKPDPFKSNYPYMLKQKKNLPSRSDFNDIFFNFARQVAIININRIEYIPDAKPLYSTLVKIIFIAVIVTAVGDFNDRMFS